LGFPVGSEAFKKNVINCSSLQFKWRAGGESHVSAEFDLRVSGLTIAGVMFDVVNTVQNVDKYKWFNSASNISVSHPVLEYWRSQNTRPTCYPTGEPAIEAYAMALTAGQDFDLQKAIDKRAEFRADFAAYIIRLFGASKQDTSQYSALMEEARSGSWLRYEAKASQVCWNRSLFITLKGYMGLGPSPLQLGDIVCILFGGIVPFILRPKNGYYQLVGDAYVHGIMEGEAIQKWEAGEFEKRVFEIH
jgi:hypothetical protein